MQIDVEGGILLVLGKPMMPTKGLCIGSQVAAGAASITAAWREELAIRQEPEEVRRELEDRCFIRRWLDDLWVMYEQGVSPALLGFLRFIQSRHFYGQGLRRHSFFL